MARLLAYECGSEWRVRLLNWEGRSGRIGKISLAGRQCVNEIGEANFRQPTEPKGFCNYRHTPFRDLFLKLFISCVAGHEDETFDGTVVHFF